MGKLEPKTPNPQTQSAAPNTPKCRLVEEDDGLAKVGGSLDRGLFLLCFGLYIPRAPVT